MLNILDAPLALSYAEICMSTRDLPSSGVGCFSMVMLLIVLLFIVGGVVSSQDGRNGADSRFAWVSNTPLSQQPTLIALITPTATSAAATPTLHPSATASHTPAPTATAAATATATAAATATPTMTRASHHAPVTTKTGMVQADAELYQNTPTPTPTVLPLPTPFGVYSYTVKVPILMYHYISVPPEDADIYRKDLSVTPDNFRAQMAYLHENGFTTIDFYELSLAITGKILLPEKPVLLTLDDGYRDNYENAFPILLEFGHKATFFIVSEFIDNGYENYLTWEMVHEMAAAGMRFESHSRTHPDLRNQPRDYLIWQILGSQQTIAHHIGYTPRYFAYPAGRYDEETIQILQDLHFWGAVTTAGGKWHSFDNRYTWPRLRMRYTTRLAEFADFVAPGDVRHGLPPER